MARTGRVEVALEASVTLGMHGKTPVEPKEANDEVFTRTATFVSRLFVVRGNDAMAANVRPSKRRSGFVEP